MFRIVVNMFISISGSGPPSNRSTKTKDGREGGEGGEGGEGAVVSTWDEIEVKNGDVLATISRAYVSDRLVVSWSGRWHLLSRLHVCLFLFLPAIPDTTGISAKQFTAVQKWAQACNNRARTTKNRRKQ